MSIADNLCKIADEKAYWCNRAGVNEDDVQLIAVSKTVDTERVEEAYNYGIRMFGENRVQEFVKKRDELPKDIAWNIIGQLQTNKVKYIINQGVFLLHSLDRISLAQALQVECLKRNSKIDALIELNLSGEDTKSGLFEEELDGFIESVLQYDRINIKGFMTIGPTFGNETQTRTVFAKAKRIFDNTKNKLENIKYLSMGMSGDFGWAIMEGSNMVRIGSSIFGRRT